VEGVLRWSVTDVAAKKEVILAGMGWGGLPEHVVADALASGELVTLDVPEFEVGAMELFAIRRRDRAHGVVASALWEELKRAGASAAAATRKRGRGSAPRMSAKAATTRRRPSNGRGKGR
jgi:DNA-binding transcriptional LysR family regulator